MAIYGDHVELTRIAKANTGDEQDVGDDFASTLGTGGVLGTKFKNVNLYPSKEEHWKKWIGLYNAKMLSKGDFWIYTCTGTICRKGMRSKRMARCITRFTLQSRPEKVGDRRKVERRSGIARPGEQDVSRDGLREWKGLRHSDRANGETSRHFHRKSLARSKLNRSKDRLVHKMTANYDFLGFEELRPEFPIVNNASAGSTGSRRIEGWCVVLSSTMTR
jgi:hypothetical protein